MAAIFETIDTGGGGDFTSWQAWEDAIPVTTSPDSYTGEQIDEEISGAVLVIAGHTTTPSTFIQMTAQAGASFVDNSGIETNALEYDATKGAAFSNTNNYITLMTPTDDDIFINRLQFETTSTSSITLSNGGGTQSETVEADQCIFEFNNTAGFHPGGPGFIIKNSLAIQRASGVSQIIESFNGPNFFNCTLICPDSLTPATNAISSAHGTGVIQNCLVFGATNVFVGSTSWTSTTNLTDDASAPTGFTTQAFTDQFENTDNDFRLKSGADAIDAGTDDTTNGTPSINGVARTSGNYDIGAWEFVAAGGGQAWPSRVKQMSHLLNR